MYYIDYHTGAGNEYAKTLEEAMSLADKGAEYTQQNISIIDENGICVAQRCWFGVAYDDDEYDCEHPIEFGTYGFYDDWDEDKVDVSDDYQGMREEVYAGDGFWICRDPLRRIWFEDNNSICQLSSMPEEPEDIVWSETVGWVFADGSALPWLDD